MKPITDLTGKKFNRLTVIEYAGKNNKNKNHWLCKCDCGNEKIIRADSFTSGHTKSCGCEQKETMAKMHFLHGLSDSKIYSIWEAMKNRCLNPNFSDYKNYGGRGIGICNEWMDFIGFYNDMNSSYKTKLTIERIDNEKGYSKDNCKWISFKEQQNNKRTNHYVIYNNEKLTLKQLTEKYNLNYKTISDRLYKGWTIDEAIAIKSRGKRKNELQETS